MSAPYELAWASRRWDRVWRVAKPADYINGLYRLHQIRAFHLLRSRVPLTNGEAERLQTLAYQSSVLTKADSLWLGRVEAGHEELAA